MDNIGMKLRVKIQHEVTAQDLDHVVGNRSVTDATLAARGRGSLRVGE